MYVHIINLLVTSIKINMSHGTYVYVNMLITSFTIDIGQYVTQFNHNRPSNHVIYVVSHLSKTNIKHFNQNRHISEHLVRIDLIKFV
jgi:hypothetical protein